MGIDERLNDHNVDDEPNQLKFRLYFSITARRSTLIKNQ